MRHVGCDIFEASTMRVAIFPRCRITTKFTRFENRKIALVTATVFFSQQRVRAPYIFINHLLAKNSYLFRRSAHTNITRNLNPLSTKRAIARVLIEKKNK